MAYAGGQHLVGVGTAANDATLTNLFIAANRHTRMAQIYEDYFAACEAVFRRYGGRPHWGKLHTLTHADFSMLYPELDAFQLVRRRLDPKGMFSNDHLRTVLGPPMGDSQ